jgi:flagellin
MALGVLNNLSAIYAENNINNTQSSLQTVLQQLSSGSKINSGADDAAGLSLVNGLAANSAALTQSKTNATEGVGLLEVADGALSQVTSLLNRAITLATEASNGTLNSSQGEAANQEYQSILAEINNVGSTTTYNQQTVFSGNTIAIYTGDSSTTGSSVDNLNIRSLSESGIGDTNGQMSYSSGEDNVFIDLSNAGINAAITDSLGAATATTTVNVSYLSKGAGGAAVTSTAAISVGAGTSYSNTTQGLITAINNSGLGLSATFATAQQSGTATVAAAIAAAHGGGGATDTGIEISAEGIGTGTNGVGVVGALSLTSGDTLGGSLTIVGNDGASHSITLGTANSTDTLQNLQSTINAAGYGVTASINNAGTQMTFTSADSKVTVAGTNLTDISPAVPTTTSVTAAAGPVLGTLTVGNTADTITGILAGTQGDGLTPYSINLTGQTLAQVATLVNTTDIGYGITATLNQQGNKITFTATPGDLGAPTLANVGNITTTLPANPTPITLTESPSTATSGSTTLGTLNILSTDTLSGSLVIGSSTIAIGSTDNTALTLAAAINKGNYGVTATYNSSSNTMTFTSVNSSMNVDSTSLDEAVGAGTPAPVGLVVPSGTVDSHYYSIGISGTVQDTSTAATINSVLTYGGTTNVGLTTDLSGATGIAATSYSDDAGASLKGTDLLNQLDARSTLTQLNSAITAVAAQDGYIGAQINMLNSISQVMSTQQENLTSAQNAIQATDYASATANMSKYEILSQTGIAALAQANTVQQEVTKLLQ